jgi:hypothetical protein
MFSLAHADVPASVCFRVLALRYGQDETQASFSHRPVAWYARVLPAAVPTKAVPACGCNALRGKLGDAYTGPTHNSLFLPEKVATSDGHVTRPFDRAMSS